MTRSRRFVARPVRVASLLSAAWIITLLGCARPYLASDFATTYQPRTRVVAVAPIANLTEEPDGAKAGSAIRDAIYSELSRRQEGYTVAIQDIAETDKRIHESAMTDSAASRLPGPDLCELLGVDAVMKGNITRYTKHGAVGQVATLVFFGSATGSEVEASVAIYDGGDGRMIWQHNIEKAGGFLSSPDELRKQVGGAVAKKFPYKKQRD